MRKLLKSVDRIDILIIILALLLPLSSWLPGIIFARWIALFFVVVVSLKHGFRLGLLSALWIIMVVIILQFGLGYISIYSVISSTAMYSIIAAITGRSIDVFRQNREELHRKNEQLNHVIEAQTEMVARADSEGYLYFTNTAYLQYFGLNADEVTDVHMFDFMLDKEKCSRVLQSLSPNNPIADIESRVELKTGEIRWNSWNLHAFFDEKGKVPEYQLVGRDITEQKQAEKKLQETNKELEIKQNQIEEELEKAKQIHERTLLGKFSEIGAPDDISLEAHYHPAQRIGGDLYNFIRIEDKLIIYLSDVTGHGVEAAIISTFVKETIENYVDLGSRELTPEKILTHVYRQYIKDDFPEDYFVCIFMAVLDLNTYELTYTSAGMHFYPFVKLADGSCINLKSEGPPISGAIGQELMEFRIDSITLTPGSIVLFYTDGIAEQKNEEGSSYEERLKNTFYSQYSKFPPELVKEIINNDFVEFNGSLQGDDDITYVILQINPPERKQYYWELNSTSQELENFYSEVFPILIEYVNEELSIQGLYELIVNAMEHGNNFDSDKKVYIHVELTNDYVLAMVEDEGEGFNWKEKTDNKTHNIINSGEERGRGILMASSLCDGLFYNEKGNKAFLILESKT